MNITTNLRNLLTLTLTLSLGFMLAVPGSASADLVPLSELNTPVTKTVCEAADLDIASSATFLQDQATIETEYAASLIDMTLADESARLVVAGDGVAFSRRLISDGSGDNNVIVPLGLSMLTFGGETVELAEGSVLLLEVHHGDTTIDSKVTVYDAMGGVSMSLSHQDDGITGVARLLRLKGDGMEGVAVASMYGDIIMGGMALDDFDD